MFFLACTVGEGITQLVTGGDVGMMACLGGRFLLWVDSYVVRKILRYKMFRYRLSEDEVEIGAGVFFRRKRGIPVRRIQNVVVKRNFVLRILGITAINLESAVQFPLRPALHSAGVPLTGAWARRRILGIPAEPVHADVSDATRLVPLRYSGEYLIVPPSPSCVVTCDGTP